MTIIPAGRSSSGKSKPRRTAFRACRAGEQSGQALVIVIGLVTMIFLGVMVMFQNVTGHYPLVEQDVLQHEAYRAMLAGANEYTSEANSNPDYVMCNAYIYSGTKYTSSSNNNMTLVGDPSTRNLSSTGLCSGPSVGSWTKVPNLATTKGPPAWFLYGSPSIYNCTGGTSKCPAAVWVSMQIVGAAGFTSDMSYDTGTVTFDPQNGFLLNLWWLNYDQQDPASLGTNISCDYYWAPSQTNPPGTDALKAGCASVDFITGETLTGNIFSNDSIFICGTPTINGAVSTGDPTNYFVDDGCGNSVPSGTYTEVKGQPVEPIPTDDAVLGAVAAQGGCLYQGPTEFQLAQNGSQNSLYPTTQWGMDVTTPATLTRSNSGPGSNDADNDTGNSNPCVPASSGGWVPYPSNGVVFVQDCSGSNPECSGSGYNPLSFYGTNNAEEFGTYGPTEGDAIVEGTVQGPLTIAAENNVVIAGNICYQSWTNCGTAPSTQTTADVLGLIAYNYIEVNHPVSGGNNASACPSNEAPMGPGTSLDCSLDPGTTGTYPNTGTTYIDAAILALNHQFWVNYFDKGGALGNLEINGSISEDWRGPVGQYNSSQQITHGYSKQYDYDPRLEYLSPPQYLTPGTSSWALGSLSSSKGFCPPGITGCSTIP